MEAASHCEHVPGPVRWCTAVLGPYPAVVDERPVVPEPAIMTEPAMCVQHVPRQVVQPVHVQVAGNYLQTAISIMSIP